MQHFYDGDDEYDPDYGDYSALRGFNPHGVNKLRGKHGPIYIHNTQWTEKEKLTKDLTGKVDTLLHPYVNKSLVEFRKSKEVINKSIKDFLEKSMSTCEYAHTAEWLVTIETLPHEQHGYIVADATANLKFSS